jgi:PAS domain S-box-containing protein
MEDDNEEQLLRAVTLQNARAILLARERAERALRESEERLRVTLASIGDAVIVCDANGHVTYLNPVAEELTRWTQADATGAPLNEVFRIVHEQTRNTVENPCTRVLREGGVVGLANHTVLIARDGTERAIDDSGAPLRDAEGNIIGVVLVFRDVTERRHAEALVELQRDTLEMLVQGTPLKEVLKDLALAMEKQSQHRVRTAIHLLDASGTRFGLAVAPGLPESYCQATEGMEIATRTGPCCVAALTGERVTVGDVSLHSQWNAFAEFALPLGIRAGWSTPISSSQGEILGTFANYYNEPREPTKQDIAIVEMLTRTVALAIERARAQRDQARLAAIVEWSDDAIVSKDLNGFITSWNKGAERLFGYTAAEAVGQPVTMLIPENHLDEEPGIIERIRRGESIDHYETQRKHKNGALLDVSLTVSPIRDPSGAIIGASKFARDITKSKLAEAERERLLESEQQARREADAANRTKDEFLATVSHELRTPLNAILGWTHMLMRGQLDAETSARGLETIARSANAQNQLISDLLDVSRIISGQLRFKSGVVDLVPVIEAATETVRPAADAKGIALQLMLDPAAGLVSGDATRLQQIVWNLLTNAVKFTSRDGFVEVRLKRQGTDVGIIVSDTGEGINPEFVPYMFDRFRQAESTTRRHQGGLGLGLAIVRHLVEAHGGTVWAASKGLGKGATFTVTLPLLAVSRDGSDTNRSASGKKLTEQASLTILKGLRVLVIDDEPDARELLTLALAQSGAEVKAAANARLGLDILKAWRPDVLVSDIGMPGQDGYDLIRSVRALESENGGRIPALALTGYASADDVLRAQQAGFQTHMSKPVSPNDLVSAVARLAATVNVRPSRSVRE